MSASNFAHRAARLVATTCMLGLLCATGVVFAQGLYQPPSATQVAGTTPLGVAAADFALSGFQSLVVTDSASKNMKVYLATGPATFASPTTYKTCTDPTAVLAADVNQDGYPDIVLACTSSNIMQIWLNQGASNPGAFTEYTSKGVTQPVAIAAGDFLGNGTIGAAFAGSSGVTVFLNQGGTIVQHSYSVSGTPTGIVTGDFNNDGHLDLAVSTGANNAVTVLLGDGAGNFSVLGSYSTGSGTNPAGIVAADFNNDGKLDVATINPGNNTATILLGNGDGTLGGAIAQATGKDPIAIVTTDVNSDGLADVIAFDNPAANSGEMDVLLGNGDGTLQTAQVSSLSFTPGTLAAVADFNRDGKPDLALTQQNTDSVGLLLNNTLPTQYPDGRSYSAASQIAQGNGNMADAVAVGDFNKDGLADIAVSYLEDNAVRVMTNNGFGGFNTAATYAVGNQPYDVVSADLNGDGYPDLVTANTNPNSATGSVSVLLNNGKGGNGTFAAAVNYTVGKDPYRVAVGDLNNDGFPDIAVTNYGSNTVSILLGSKTGAFTLSGTTLSTCANPYGIAIGDFGQGRQSIAVACYGSSQMEIFANNGDGTFASPNIYTTDTHPGPLVVGDFNRDGKLDIVTGNTTANDVSFFAGQGNFNFVAGVISPSLNFPSSIAAGDVNGDGILDIVGVAPNFNQVVVTLGKGDGTFGTFQQRDAGRFGAAKQPWGVALGDFLNDGQLDIVTANTYNQVNIALPAYQQRYIAQYPPVPGGHPSVDVLTNQSAAAISFSTNPAAPLPYNNSGTTITATVQPVISGNVPTGSVIFEDATGAPLGAGPYGLTGGQVSLSTGRLGSGQYLFTTLYSGDANYQPTTASGNTFALTVSGTPVSLALNPSSVSYANKFTATATVTGTIVGGAPQGTVTIFAVNGATTVTLGTYPLTASGNNATASATYTAVGPNFNVGTYQLYAIFNPSNATYQPGSSGNANLVVTGEPTNLTLSCGFGLLSVNCTATVTATTTNTPVPAGTVVNFTFTGTPSSATETVGANGQANFTAGIIIGIYTVTAQFPQQSNYLASNTGSVTSGCIIICLDRRHPFGLNSLTGWEPLNTRTPIRPGELKQNKPGELPLY